MMIKHIVFLKIVRDLPVPEKSLVLKEVRQRLRELPGMIPEIVSFEIGINQAVDDKAADLVILSDFDSQEDLKTYLIHPAHKAFIEWNRDRCPKSAVVDFEF